MYKSSVSKGLVVFITLGLGASFSLMLYSHLWWMAGLMMILWIFIMHMLYTTTYQVTGNDLLISCGFFYRKSIDISTIRSIRATNNILSSPAASFDRLEIRFNKFDSILISPKDKTGFVKQLLELNPAIEVKPGLQQG